MSEENRIIQDDVPDLRGPIDGPIKLVIHPTYAGFEDIFKSFGARDDVLDLKDAPDPVGEMFERAPSAAAIKSANGAAIQFDWAAPSESDVDSEEPEFWRAPRVIRHGEATPDQLAKADGRSTLAKKLGITRTEEVVAASGDKWVHAYNAANELVHARLLESAE